MLLIEPDRPVGGGPGADKGWGVDTGQQEPEQPAADPMPPVVGAHVRVPDQRHVLHGLGAHDADERPAQLESPEFHPAVDRLPKLGWDMYGSCQQSTGMTPLYAMAASFTIAQVVSKSLDVFLECFIPRSRSKKPVWGIHDLDIIHAIRHRRPKEFCL